MTDKPRTWPSVTARTNHLIAEAERINQARKNGGRNAREQRARGHTEMTVEEWDAAIKRLKAVLRIDDQ